ncbi:hypothetical protein ES703_92362 [subsurface metagenome]
MSPTIIIGENSKTPIAIYAAYTSLTYKAYMLPNMNPAPPPAHLFQISPANIGIATIRIASPSPSTSIAFRPKEGSTSARIFASSVGKMMMRNATITGNISP